MFRELDTIAGAKDKMAGVVDTIAGAPATMYVCMGGGLQGAGFHEGCDMNGRTLTSYVHINIIYHIYLFHFSD